VELSRPGSHVTFSGQLESLPFRRIQTTAFTGKSSSSFFSITPYSDTKIYSFHLMLQKIFQFSLPEKCNVILPFFFFFKHEKSLAMAQNFPEQPSAIQHELAWIQLKGSIPWSRKLS